MKIIIDVKNLTTDDYKTLKAYSKTAIDHLDAIHKIHPNTPIETIGFNLKRIRQSLEYITDVVNRIEPND